MTWLKQLSKRTSWFSFKDGSAERRLKIRNVAEFDVASFVCQTAQLCACPNTYTKGSWMAHTASPSGAEQDNLNGIVSDWTWAEQRSWAQNVVLIEMLLEPMQTFSAVWCRSEFSPQGQGHQCLARSQALSISQGTNVQALTNLLRASSIELNAHGQWKCLCAPKNLLLCVMILKVV